VSLKGFPIYDGQGCQLRREYDQDCKVLVPGSLQYPRHIEPSRLRFQHTPPARRVGVARVGRRDRDASGAQHAPSLAPRCPPRPEVQVCQTIAPMVGLRAGAERLDARVNLALEGERRPHAFGPARGLRGAVYSPLAWAPRSTNRIARCFMKVSRFFPAGMLSAGTNPPAMWS